MRHQKLVEAADAVLGGGRVVLGRGPAAAQRLRDPVRVRPQPGIVESQKSPSVVVDITIGRAGQGDLSHREERQRSHLGVHDVRTGFNPQSGARLPAFAPQHAEGNHPAHDGGADGAGHDADLPVTRNNRGRARGDGLPRHEEPAEPLVQMPLVLGADHDLLADVATLGEAHMISRERLEQEVLLVEVHAEPGPSRLDAEPF